MIFILYLGIILFCIVRAMRLNQLNEFSMILIIGLIFIAAFRFRYGYDYENYYIIYIEINGMSNVIHTIYEKGFALLIHIFRSSNMGFYSFMAFIAGTALLTKAIAINKISVFPYVSWLVYFLSYLIYSDMEQMRFGLALGIVSLALAFELQNHKITFNVLVLLATSFHYSAIFFVLFQFISAKRYRKPFFMATFMIAIALSFVNLFGVLGFINAQLLHNVYLSEKLALYAGQSGTVFSVTLLIRCWVFVSYYLFCSRSSSSRHLRLLNGYFAGILIFVGFNSIQQVALRGSIYFKYLEVFMIADMAYDLYLRRHQRNKKWLISALSLAALLGYFILKFLLILRDPVYGVYHGM